MHRILNHGQRAKPQKIHFQKSQFFQRCHRKLCRDRSIRSARQRHIFVYILLADYDSGCVHGRMTRKSLKTFGHINQMMNLFVLCVHSCKLRIHLECLINRNIQFIRNHLGNRIDLRIRQIHHTSHITDDASCRQRTERYNLHHAVFSVFSHYIINDFLPSFKAKVNINIRHGYTLRIQKTLKKQIILDRIEFRDSKRIGNQASGRRTSSGSNHDIMITGILDKIPDNQEIIHISHILNCIQLIGKTFFQFLCHRLITFLQSFKTQFVQILPRGIAFRHIVSWQLGHTKFNLHIAAHRDFVGVFQCFQSIWK